MKHVLLSFTVLLSALLVIASTVQSQTSFEEQRLLTLLRGEWEYPTFEEVHTFRFLSDTKIEVDGLPQSYSLSQNSIRISDEGENNDFLCSIERNRLLVTYPDGVQRKFNRKKFGEVEQLCVGAFYPSEDTSWFASCLQFYDDMKFTLTEPTENSTSNFSRRDGYFRAEDKSVILAFDDGEIEQAFIRFHSSDGLVDGLLFREKLFDRELIFTQEPKDDTSDEPTPLPSPGPPPQPRPEPHPPCPPPLPIAIPVYYPVNPAPPIENKRRDFGTTRHESTENASNSGRREPQTSRHGKP
ncbi:MAG: hypothetical protein HY960_07425 [Ignavibacteriae bacterium]|nr:hypothetical protein [Ignavibacteriota bacterium]